MALPSAKLHAIPEVKKPGVASQAKAAKLVDELNKMRIEYGDDMIQLATLNQMGGTGLNKQTDEQAGQDLFPVRLFPHDPYDAVVENKLNIPDAFGQKTLTDQDIEWHRRKADNLQAANFKAWAAQQYDARDPAQAALLNKLLPGLQSEREQIIEQRAELAKRLAKIHLRGAQDESDMKLLWLLSTGVIQPPRGELWDPESWFSDDNNAEERLARGLFSPRRIFSGKTDTNFVPFDQLYSAIGERGNFIRQPNDFGAKAGSFQSLGQANYRGSGRAAVVPYSASADQY